ncbi:MAG: hypothetical protein KR126chlam4_01140 [Candidatus Anoxychlamydiales bacterium]|nr:hypothetical protein [Candidatus Anoxychlamydiales bacterium]HEU64898.1 YopN family type III secretion system gatekeeper subunit [Chlamydiota bacterium]
MGEINKPAKISQMAKQQATQRIKAQQLSKQQVTSKRALKAYQESGFNQAAMRRNFKPLEEQRFGKKHVSKSGAADDEVEIIEEVKNTEEMASRFNKKNQELKEKTLLILRDLIKDDDTVEDILRKVLDFYPDYTLADDALEFLLQTTDTDLALKVHKAKEFLNTEYKREIIAGRNINLQAQVFSKEGLGTPTNLRDMYRDITGNPRTALTLFDELSSKYTYENMKPVIRFLLHSLGSDLKSKGPSITRPELMRLIEDAQMLQAILGVYRFFISREGLINSQFDHFGLILPKILNFEMISKLFINLLKERYVTSEKISLIAKHLGISEEFAAQIIIFSQMRDAIRHTSMKLYKSQKHRFEALDAFIETLEELEEYLAEEEED